MAAFLVLVGIVMLYYGGEALVENSIRLARSFNVSHLVIGLTVVAFATSCPELAASITAALRESPDIAVGNVFGSNIANLGLILGISALILPLYPSRRLIRRDAVFMVFVTVLVFPLMVGDLLLNRLEGLVLVVLLGLFLHNLLRDPETKEQEVVPADELDKPQRPVWLSALGVALGVGLLVGGATALVAGATDIALALGITERVIGLTLVALGTSLPELAASIVATRKGEGALVLGNVVGSNIFNLLMILGITSLVHPINVTPAAMQLDFWVMLGISVVVLIFLATKRRLVRIEGAILLLVYLVYTVFLFTYR
ncbi:MAG: calcium/sodium antiporter [bacterium]|nr:calcium/sodium antiporter [bacterium]